VRVHGYPPRSATFHKKTDAKKWAAQTETEIRTGMLIRSDTSKQHTFKAMIARYVESVLIDKARGGRDQRNHLVWWERHLGHYALSEINSDLIVRCIDSLKKSTTKHGKPPAPATVMRYLMALSHVYTIAIKQWGWCEKSPVENVTRPKIKNARTRYLSDSERTKLLEACRSSSNADLYSVVILAISTGMRKSEIMSMRWEDIHHSEDQGFIRVHLHKTKTDQDRAVLLTSLALDLIEARRKTMMSPASKVLRGLIFPSTKLPDQPVDLRKPWENAIQVAGIENFRFHDLRHTTASYLALNGTSLLAISKVLGHATTKMTERYTHLAGSHIDEAVKRMNENKFGV
jgi:integrase